jgi:hypothetical protein
MGWLKALAIGVAVIVVISIVSAVMHLLVLAFWAIAIGAVVAVALKARSQLRGRRAGKTRKVEAEQTQTALDQRQLDVRPQAVQRQRDTARLNQDVEDELARLKRELE